MQVTVLPASARTSQATIRALLAHPSKPNIKGIYRDPSKASEEFVANPRFEAVKGNLQDASSLELALQGSAAVVVTIPPVRDPSIDITANAVQMAQNVKTAVEKVGSVKNLVMVSTKGAQYGRGLGEVLSTLHHAENILRDTPSCSEITFLRCAYFMENWESSLQTVKTPNSPFFFSTITPLDYAMPMVAIKDIGIACADIALTSSDSGSSYSNATAKVKAIELHGPRSYSPLDVKAAFEEILGNGKEVQIRPVEKEGLLGFFGRVFPHPKVARWFADMILATIPGGIMAEDPKPTGAYIKGSTELVEVLRGVW